MLDLLAQWDCVAARVASAAKIALFLDFDGTLARFERRPADVSLRGAIRRALIALAASPRFRVWIISGRRLADVRARVGVRNVRCLGLYGWETGVSQALRPETREALAFLREQLNRLLAPCPGVWVEDKEHALAIHYRDRGASAGEGLRLALVEAVQPYSKLLRIQAGSNVWELMPRELGDKGAAVRRQTARLGGRTLPIYVGDDRVDEPAFVALASGVTIRVGSQKHTQARYRLASVGRVGVFLQMLAREFA